MPRQLKLLPPQHSRTLIPSRRTSRTSLLGPYKLSAELSLPAFLLQTCSGRCLCAYSQPWRRCRQTRRAPTVSWSAVLLAVTSPCVLVCRRTARPGKLWTSATVARCARQARAKPAAATGSSGTRCAERGWSAPLPGESPTRSR